MKTFTSPEFDFYKKLNNVDYIDIFSNKHLLKEFKFNKPNMEYLLKYVTDLNCKAVIVEKNYIDRDYLIDYSQYYVRCLRDYPKKCRRVHFFNDKIDFNHEDFLKLILNEKSKISEEKLNNSYIGFSVVRPLPETIIGRTVLRQYVPKKKEYRNCVRNYEVNLFGQILTVEDSLAFQEQDTVTAACATSSLWSAFHKTHELFNLGSPPSPSEITYFATEVMYGTRPITSKGLSTDQMCQAIHKVSLEPHVISLYKKPPQITPVLSFIYSYVRGGIPVILVFSPESGGRHAITISGYKLEDNPSITREVDQQKENKYCRLKGLRISELYVHDDQFGAFAKMIPINGDPICPVFFNIPWKNTSVWGNMHPFAIIVPLYPKIRVCFLSVYKWISRINSTLEISSNLKKNEIEWDIYFSTLKSYKKDVVKKSNCYNKNSLKNILLGEHPRFLWRCIAKYKNKEILEISADATDTPKSFFLYNMVFFNNNFKNDIKKYLANPLYRDYTKVVYTSNLVNFLEKSIIN